MPTFDPFDEGDALTAANLTSRLTVMRTWVNALPARSVQRWGLDAQHVPPQTYGKGHATELFPNGFQAGSPALGGPVGAPFTVCTNSLPYTAGAQPVTYQTFDTDGGTSYGAGGVHGGGWRIPSQAAAASKMELTFDTPAFRLDTYGLGLLVRARVEVYNASAGFLMNDTSVDWGCSSNTASNAQIAAHCGIIGIGFESGAGTRYVLERTVRWNNLLGVARGTMSTSTWIRQTDLSVGNGTIAKVFGVVASQWWAPSPIVDPASDNELDIRTYAINILPIRYA